MKFERNEKEERRVDNNHIWNAYRFLPGRI